ncbi:MAG: hypothetical protein V4496_06810 [Pseudomonadota bacterium]
MRQKYNPVNFLYYLDFLLSFLIPMSLVANFTLNHFYVYGGYIEDSGWLAYLMTHAISWPLQNPPILIGKFGESFFGIHFSLAFYVTSFLFYLSNIFFHLPYIIFFSFLQGLWFGLLSLACYSLFIQCPQKKLQVLLAFLFSMLVMVNGISLATVVSFHFEIASTAFFLLFLSLRINGYARFCYVPLILGLLLREDIGLHYFGAFIVLSIVIYWWRQDLPKLDFKYFLKVSCFCLSYALVAFFIQYCFFHPGTLNKIYLGEGFYQHVNVEFMRQRMWFFLYHRSYLYVPILISLFLAIIRRDLLQASGVFISTPWIVFSFFAASPMAGALSFYYAFPVLMTLLWPAICYALNKSNVQLKRSFFSYWMDASTIVGLSFLLFVGFHQSTLIKHQHSWKDYPWEYYEYPWAKFGFQWLGYWKNTQHTLDALFNEPLLKDNYTLDPSAAAIELDKIDNTIFYYKKELSSDQASMINYLIYRKDTLTFVQMIIREAHLTKTCFLKNTDYKIIEKTDAHPDLCR